MNENNTTTWTASLVKQELPMVMIRFGKQKPIAGRTSGRLNRFATVSVTNSFPRSNAPLFIDVEFAWETIAHSLNTGRPLRAD